MRDSYCPWFADISVKRVVPAAIENRVHYVRDVTFGEDASVVRKGNIPRVMAAFRNTAIALLRREGYGNLAAPRRYFSANPKQGLEIMGCKITE